MTDKHHETCMFCLGVVDEIDNIKCDSGCAITIHVNCLKEYIQWLKDNNKPIECMHCKKPIDDIGIIYEYENNNTKGNFNELMVFSRSYNVLCIISGIGGLTYSN